MEFEVKSDSEGRRYKVMNGTYYSIETSDDMVRLLEKLRASHTRIRFHWGNAKTGEDWGDIHDVTGTIGRSTGSIKIPLLIYNNRSRGGGGILTHCIVKMVATNNGRIIYQHPKYHTRD